MPRAKSVAAAKAAEQTAPTAPPVAPMRAPGEGPVPAGSIRILGGPSDGKPVIGQAPARPIAVEALVPKPLMPSNEEGSFTAGFHRNPKYPDPALAPAVEPVTASPQDPRNSVRILGASPSMAQEKVHVLF